MSRGGADHRRARIEDLVKVEVEHLVGLRTGLPLVKLRVESDHTVVAGQMSVAQAREIASHLEECAARAEYEVDLLGEMQRSEWTDEMIAAIFVMVRSGETRRHTDTSEAS